MEIQTKNRDWGVRASDDVPGFYEVYRVRTLTYPHATIHTTEVMTYIFMKFTEAIAFKDYLNDMESEENDDKMETRPNLRGFSRVFRGNP